ncbi:MAG: hypothetical protein K6F96_00650 [Bacteroidales bacterium]|nr:hypothetical protein [Bacteroidales bacterium]
MNTNQNPIDDVLDELDFSEAQKDGFWSFLNYAKTCQETGNNRQLKSQLEEVVKGVVDKE